MGHLTVNLSDHQYDVHIGRNSYDHFTTDYADILAQADHIGILADERVAALHISTLMQALDAVKSQVVIKTVPAGENCKTSAVYTDCQSFLLREGFTRNSILIAFGGGACGDLTGFVAATFMRGIRYIQCPTTILAHDSAVGGKTAINLPEGKNMVGSFHQPVGVLFNSTLFESLPIREVRSGLAELVKHAFISDKDWSNRLLATTSITNPTIDWLDVELLKGIQVKADIVSQDEFEHSVRKFLNFGHTFGHAVEAVCGFGGMSHGESVMIGMAYSFLLGEMVGNSEVRLSDDFINFSTNNGYSFQPIHDYPFEQFLAYMVKDKKVSHGKMNFVLLKDFGKPFVTEITVNQCEQAFKELRTRTKKEVNN